jgi:hypothetical protein
LQISELRKSCQNFVSGDANPFLTEQKPAEAIGSPDSTLNKRKKNILIKETSKEQEERIRKNSPYGYLKSWRLFRFIVKSNDDVR